MRRSKVSRIRQLMSLLVFVNAVALITVLFWRMNQAHDQKQPDDIFLTVGMLWNAPSPSSPKSWTA